MKTTEQKHTPINASVVEGLREKIIEDLRPLLFEGGLEPKDLAHKNLGGRIINMFLTHATTLSDSTLREVLEEVGEDIIPAVVPHGSPYISGVNEERARIRAIITNHLEK